MRSGHQVQVSYKFLAVKQGQNLIQLLALGNSKNDGELLYRWELTLNLIYHGSEAVDVVAYVQYDSLFAALDSLEAAGL